MKIAGSVALITGAASGFGKEFCLHLLKNGGKVFAVDINKKLGEELEKKYGETFGTDNIKFMQCDVSNSKHLKNAFDESFHNFKKLNIVCNNAGIIGNVHEECLHDFENNNIRKTIDIDLTAVIESTYIGMNMMSQQKGGRGGVIINVASAADLFFERVKGLRVFKFTPVYTAAKHGVVSFTHSFKYTKNGSEDGVRVNCLCPYFVDTPMLRQKPEMRELVLKKYGLAKISDVVKAFNQCIEDESLNGDAIAIIPNGIKKVELPHPHSKI